MRDRRTSALRALIMIAYAIAVCLPASAQQSGRHWTFDDVAVGELPDGWLIDATNPVVTPAEWQVTPGGKADGGNVVLAFMRPSARTEIVSRLSRSLFNLCWTPDVAFGDGEIEVAVQAIAGRIDQGGGPIWRVQDANNYYIARYNPLERNFRLYYVKDGKRMMLDDASNIPIGTGEWFTIKIVHRGSHIEAWLNGILLLEAIDDTFAAPGGIGLWAKADSETAFDDFVVRLAK